MECTNEARTIESLLKELKTILSQPVLAFEVSEIAAESNLNLLQRNDFNLTILCNDNNNKSATTYGSEFKDANILRKLF